MFGIMRITSACPTLLSRQGEVSSNQVKPRLADIQNTIQVHAAATATVRSIIACISDDPSPPP